MILCVSLYVGHDKKAAIERRVRIKIRHEEREKNGPVWLGREDFQERASKFVVLLYNRTSAHTNDGQANVRPRDLNAIQTTSGQILTRKVDLI